MPSLCEQSNIYRGWKWVSSRPSLAGTLSLAAALLEYSLTSELQKGEKYQEETEEGWDGSSQQGIRWLLAAVGRLRLLWDQANACCLFDCQEDPLPVWMPGNHSGYLEGRSSGSESPLGYSMYF